MSDTKKEEARRRILKKMAVSGGIVTASQVMPERWIKPVIDSVILPAHAGVSGNRT
jgi:hypothetical protein